MSHHHPAADSKIPWSVRRALRRKEKMNNHISFLLEAEAAKRRLAQLFQSEQLGRANHRSTAIVTRHSSRAARTGTKQNSKMSQENRREHGLTRECTRTAIPTSRPRQMQRDLTVSSLVLALVSVGVLLAAYTDQPVFWLLVGSAPLGVLHTIRAFLRLRVNRREGLLMFCQRDR
jgi:Flp pilus assembly protein TadB